MGKVKDQAAKTSVKVVKAATKPRKANEKENRKANEKDNRKEDNREEGSDEDNRKEDNREEGSDESSIEKPPKESKTVAEKGQVEMIVYNDVITIDGKKCLRQGTAASNPCTMSAIGAGDLYKSLCILEIESMDLESVESKLKEIITRNRGWRKASDAEIDRSKLDEFFIMTSERIDANQSSARKAQKHNRRESRKVDMINVVEPLNTDSLEAFIELNLGNKKGVKLIIAVVLDGKVSSNADALKGSGSSVSKGAFADRLAAAVRSMSGQLYEWHKVGSHNTLTEDVQKFNSYLRFNGDQKNKADNVKKFLNSCQVQILKKQGDLPEYENLRVVSNVESCKGLLLNLANRITASQLEEFFGTAISKPGELVEINSQHS